VSAALAGVAQSARARGAPAAAAEAWRRAIETAPDADEALWMRLERARDLAQAGHGSAALVEIEKILDRGCSAELRADAEVLQGQLLISQGRLDQAAQGLHEAAARIRDRDPARAAVMLCGAAFVEASQAELTAAVETAERAAALAGPFGGASAAAAESTLGWILIAAGEGARGYPLLLRHAGRGDAAGRTLQGLQASAQLGLFACWMEDYGTARREVERAVTRASMNKPAGASWMLISTEPAKRAYLYAYPRAPLETIERTGVPFLIVSVSNGWHFVRSRPPPMYSGGVARESLPVERE
jgi:hypothetical protein